MNSVEIVVADAAEAEQACDVMWVSGVEGIEERALDDGSIALIAGVEPHNTHAVVAALEGRWPVTQGVMQPELWAESWKPYAKAVRLSGGFVVQPPWLDRIATDEETEILLDPGAAWGHGAHPSTVLAAEHLIALESLFGFTVFDIGCGSGLLSVLAALRGCDSVTVIDIDPAAVTATVANAEVNGVARQIVALTSPLADVAAGPQFFDIVVANIGLGVLVERASEVAAVVAPGGRLILSGLLVDQVDAAVAAYEGFRVLALAHLDGWGSVLLQKA